MKRQSNYFLQEVEVKEDREPYLTYQQINECDIETRTEFCTVLQDVGDGAHD